MQRTMLELVLEADARAGVHGTRLLCGLDAGVQSSITLEWVTRAGVDRTKLRRGGGAGVHGSLLPSQYRLSGDNGSVLRCLLGECSIFCLASISGLQSC